MNEEALYKTAIATYGEREQSAVAMEECAELIRAINKYHRKPCEETRKNLVEEIADVRVMIEQVKMMYDISEDSIAAVMEEKQLRLFERLGG